MRLVCGFLYYALSVCLFLSQEYYGSFLLLLSTWTFYVARELSMAWSSERTWLYVIWTKNFSWKQFFNNFTFFHNCLPVFFIFFLGQFVFNSYGSPHNIWYVVSSLLITSKHSVIVFLISSSINEYLKNKSYKNFPRVWLFFDLYFCNYFQVLLQCGYRMGQNNFLLGKIT